MPIRPSRAVAVATAGAALISGLATFAAPAASAAPTIPDPATQASLDIHKFNGLTDATNPNDGRPLDTAQSGRLNMLGAPMFGVAFDVYRVEGVDLATNDGWRAANTLNGAKVTPADVANGSLAGADGVTYRLGTPTQVLTDETGNARFTGDLGLYLVAENRADSTLTEETKNGLTVAAPFLVTLPMTDPTSQTGWDYTVDVYPKNVVDTIVKTVRDGNRGVTDQDTFTVGQNLTYHLSSSIVVSDNDGDAKVTGADLGYYYAVIDELDPNLQFRSATVDVLSEGWTSTTRLTEGDDYVLRHADGRVTVSMTRKGLDVLAANGGGTVETDIVATVATMPDGGIIPNTAAFVPSNRWLSGHGQEPRTAGDDSPPGSPEVKSSQVESRFGDLVIQKKGHIPAIRDNWDASPPLAGAEFELRLAGPDGECGPGDAGDPIAVSNPTDAAGFTMFEGLQLSDFANNSTVTDPARMRIYCVSETVAPPGYERMVDPARFILTVPGDVTDPAAAFSDQARDANPFDDEGGNLAVVNIATPQNMLPRAGDPGTVAWSLVGITAFTGGAAYVAFTARRRRAENAE